MLPLLAAYMAAGAAGSLGSGHGLSQTPIIGGLFSDPAQEDFENQLRNNTLAWQARLPVLQQQAKGLMGMIDQAYAPAKAALGQLYNGTTTQPAPQMPNVEAAPAPVPQMGPPAPRQTNYPLYDGRPGPGPGGTAPLGRRQGYG